MAHNHAEPEDGSLVPKTGGGVSPEEFRTPLESFFGKLDLDPVSLENRLNQSVIGQETAIKTFVHGLIEQTVDVVPEKPSSFLFLGPTGVGKNYLIEETVRLIREQNILADSLVIYGPKYNTRFTASSLLGSPPGYCGSEVKPVFERAWEEAMATDFYFMIFDEFEKAHEVVQQNLLSLTDKGTVQLANNEEPDLTKATIAMTSNAGYSDLEVRKDVIGYMSSDQDNHFRADSLIRSRFSPELLGRITPVHFRKLNQQEIMQVADLEIEKLAMKKRRLGIEMIIENDVAAHVTEEANWEDYGCRNIRNVTNSLIGNKINKKALGLLQEAYRQAYHFGDMNQTLLYTIQSIAKSEAGIAVRMKKGKPHVELYKKMQA